MLSGTRAFEGQSAASVIAAILERDPAPLDIPPALRRIIATCLTKDPDRRFQNALDLKTALTWAAEQPLVAKAEERVLRFQIEPPPGGRFALGALTSGGWEGRCLRCQCEWEDRPLGSTTGVEGGPIAIWNRRRQ